MACKCAKIPDVGIQKNAPAPPPEPPFVCYQHSTWSAWALGVQGAPLAPCGMKPVDHQSNEKH